MAIIKAGDLVVGKATGNKYIAVSDEGMYMKRVLGPGAFLDDYNYAPVVRVVNPLTGEEAFEYLSSLQKV
jgi:hypothetical protein